MKPRPKVFLETCESCGDPIAAGEVAFSKRHATCGRRVFAGTIANELISVQPMALPTGLLFYMDRMDFRYETRETSTEASGSV